MTTFAERLDALLNMPPALTPDEVLARLSIDIRPTDVVTICTVMNRADALSERLRLAVELLEAIQSDDMSDLRKSLSDDARALVARVKGELGA